MSHYSRRQSSNSALIVTVVVLFLLLVCSVGGFFIYQATATQRPMSDAAAEQETRDKTTTNPAGSVAAQSVNTGKSAAPTKGTEPQPDNRWKDDARQEYLDALNEKERRMSELARRAGALSRLDRDTATKSLKTLVDKGLARTPPLTVESAAKIAPHYVEALRREELVKSPEYAMLVARGAAPARYPAEKRKKLYDQIAPIIELDGNWSLTMPFDDLNQQEMDAAVEAARVFERDRSLRRLTADQRVLLLRAGALTLFRRELGL